MELGSVKVDNACNNLSYCEKHSQSRRMLLMRAVQMMVCRALRNNGPLLCYE